MNADILFFFDDRREALPLYQGLETLILEQIPDVRIKVSKTQISFSCRHQFAFISLLPVRKAKERPKVWMTVSFGLGYRKESCRIDAASEPYPNRWTHHLMVTSPEEIDEELMSWLKEAAEFSTGKR